MSAVSSDSADLRQRQPHNAASPHKEEANIEQESPSKEKSSNEISSVGKGKKTYGRTPDGTGKSSSHLVP